MDTVSHHGRATAYRATEYGDGPPVVYVHGSGATHRVWVEQYAPSGVGPAAAVDLSGHGESDDVDVAPGAPTLDAYADDVAAVAREVWTDYPGPEGSRVLVGNSLGGAVALWVALERDLAIDALVLTGSGAKLGVADTLLDVFETDFDDAVEMLHAPDALFHDASEELRERSVELFRRTGRPVTLRDFRTSDRFDVRHRLGEITVPALALTGEHDGLTPPEFQEYLATELPDGRWNVVPDGAHLAFLERPEAWNETVQSFLEDLDCAGPR